MDTEISDAEIISYLEYQVNKHQKQKIIKLPKPETLPRYLLLKNQRLSLK
jgi:hypothetical protein